MGDKRVVIQTLGCKLNFAESAAMMQQLEKAGYRQVPMGQPAEVCLINTCSVTGTADQKDRQAIHRIIREYPEAFVIVAGCYAQLRPQEVAAIPGVSLVLGADFKTDLLPYIQEGRQEAACILTTANQDIARFLPACARGDRTRCFLKVQDGCDYFCSYCTVPFARGRSRNPSIESLTEQARQAALQGAREIVLTGVNIGTFGRSDGSNFLQLIEALDQVEGIERYRISSLEPDLLSDEIIRFVASSRHFAPHFHLPLQSGDDEVLSLMRRHYRRELFADRVARIKEEMPHAFIGVDVIVGMRGETPERFDSSARFLAGLPISQLHVFSYSERPGTQALKIDYKVSAAEKKRRSDLLHALSEEKRLAFYRSQTGRPLQVLFEHGNKKGLMSGFSENYVRVEAPWRADWENTVQTLTTGTLNPAGSALSTATSAPLL